MSYTGKIKIDNDEFPVAATLYGTCSSLASTTEKAVVLANFDALIEGVTVAVKFVYSNTAANPTLNVNGTGAKPIYKFGTTPPGTTAVDSWNANAIVSFVYDGTSWMMLDVNPNYQDVLSMVYPVGSIYMSVNNVSPGTLFGGVWERIQDRFLLAAGSTYAAGVPGGSATKNIQHAHTTGGHVLTASELPKISGTVGLQRWDMGFVGSADGCFSTTLAGKHSFELTQSADTTRYGGFSISFGGNGSHSHGNTGNAGSTTQDIMPPYLPVYIWKRTA